jgi:hypothetical protein
MEQAALPAEARPATGAEHRPAGPGPRAQAVRRYWIVRLLFGAIWGIDATLKWLPGSGISTCP